MDAKPPPHTSLPTFSVSFPEAGDYTNCKAERWHGPSGYVAMPWLKTPEDFASVLADVAAEGENPSHPGVRLRCLNASSSWTAGGIFFAGRLEIPSAEPEFTWVVRCNRQGDQGEGSFYACSADLEAAVPSPQGPRPWMPSVGITTTDYSHPAAAGAPAGPIFPCALEAGRSAKIWCNLRGEGHRPHGLSASQGGVKPRGGVATSQQSI